jgi:hypothetical protein
MTRRLSPFTAMELAVRTVAGSLRGTIAAKYSLGFVAGRVPFNLNLGSYDEIAPYLHDGPGGVYERSSDEALNAWMPCNPNIGQPVIIDFILWTNDTTHVCEASRWADDGGRHVEA